MRHSSRWSAGLFCVLMLSGTAFAQGGGGGGGGGGFGGGGDTGGFGGGAGDSFGSDAGGGAEQQAFDPDTAMPGDWRIEFRIERDSSDSSARGRWIQVMSEVTVSGNRVFGRIRDREIEGEFDCTISPEGRCEPGRLRFTTDRQDWQDFGFEIDTFDPERAEGWATYIDNETGVTREYELILQKR